MIAMAVNKVVYGTTVLVDLTGDTVTADKLAQGVTAHDKSGAAITGTMTTGGSSANNCEAYTIDVTNPVVNFATTSGIIKAWGYAKGTTSGYTTPQYAFMGDKYQSISSWGSGSTLSLSLSVDSSGKLSGLPSSLASGTILVTRGV